MGDTTDGTDASECRYEITVKRLHYGTYTLHVWQSLPILELKLLISCLSGVIPELQRLLFRGRVLEDDKVVSDYHVQQGHTLYLVTRTRFSQTESSNAVADPISRRQRFRVDVGETFNFSLASDDNSNLGPDTPNESLSRYSYHTTGRLYDTPVAVMPDSYTFITGYLNFLRRNNAQTFRNSVQNEQYFDPISVNWSQSPFHLADILQTRRQLLVGEIAQSLSNISMVLADRANLTDPSSQRLREVRPTESVMLLNNLGNSLVELGRAISRISRGERPVASAVTLLPTRWSQNQTSTGEGNIPVATTAPRNAEITRHVRVGFLWPSPSSQQHVSSPQVATEEELEEADLEDEMEELKETDPEDEMVKTVTVETYIAKEMVGVLSLRQFFFYVGDAERVKLVVTKRQPEVQRESFLYFRLESAGFPC